MGRKPGSKNRPKLSGDGQIKEAVGSVLGHNGGPSLTDEQRQALFFNQHLPRYKAALAAKKSADVALKNVCKIAKADLGGNAVHDIKLAIEAETPEGEDAIRRRMESQARLLHWLGMPVGEQGALFPDVDLTPAVDKARAEGKRAGFRGDVCKPPHDPSVPQYHAWIEGWQEGQAVLVSTKLRPMPVQENDADLRPRFKRNDPGEELGTEAPTYSER